MIGDVIIYPGKKKKYVYLNQCEENYILKGAPNDEFLGVLSAKCEKFVYFIIL